MVMVKEEMRKGPWTEQEDLQLVCFVALFGERRWDFIAQVSGLNRTGKSCRMRWVNYLHPSLKRGRMTPQEEHLVLELHSRWGNRWSRIARKLPGRTDNEIKNYWRTHMRKKAQEQKRNVSPSSTSSSSITPSKPLVGVAVEGQLNSSGSCSRFSMEPEENDDAVNGYSMDQIWNEIAVSEAISTLNLEECKGEVCNTACPSVTSPMWGECCSDSLWKTDDDEPSM